MVGRRLCQASGIALRQSSAEKRPGAVYEVAKSSLEQLFPPHHPLNSSVKPQKHHIISALAAFQYKPKVGISHLL